MNSEQQKLQPVKWSDNKTFNQRHRMLNCNCSSHFCYFCLYGMKFGTLSLSERHTNECKQSVPVYKIELISHFSEATKITVSGISTAKSINRMLRGGSSLPPPQWNFLSSATTLSPACVAQQFQMQPVFSLNIGPQYVQTISKLLTKWKE